MKKGKQIKIEQSDSDIEQEDKWQTECDYRTLEELAAIKKDPARIKRLKAFIKEKKEDIETYDEAYFTKIGL